MIESLTPEIQMIKNHSNSFLIQLKDSCLLIDCGMDKKAKEILEVIEKTGKKLKAILITHSHLDHINGLAKIKEKFPNALVASSEEDKNAIEGKEIILPRGIKGFFFKILSFFIGYKGVKVDKILKDNENFENLKVIYTPGHTRGGLSFLFKIKKQNVLFVGDLVIVKNGKLCLAPEEFNFDKDQIKKSIEKISEIKVDLLLSGHGEPLKEKVNEKLKELIKELNV